MSGTILVITLIGEVTSGKQQKLNRSKLARLKCRFIRQLNFPHSSNVFHCCLKIVHEVLH